MDASEVSADQEGTSTVEKVFIKPINWATPCSLCGGTSDRVIHGDDRDCDPTKQRYLCRECEQKTKGHQS